MTDTPNWLTLEELHGISIVRVTRYIVADFENGKELLSLLDPPLHRNVIMDFSIANLYPRDAFIGWLLLLNKKLKTAGGRLVLCGINAPPFSDFVGPESGLGLDKIFSLYATLDEALKSFSGDP